MRKLRPRHRTREPTKGSGQSRKTASPRSTTQHHQERVVGERPADAESALPDGGERAEEPEGAEQQACRGRSGRRHEQSEGEGQGVREGLAEVARRCDVAADAGPAQVAADKALQAHVAEDIVDRLGADHHLAPEGADQLAADLVLCEVPAELGEAADALEFGSPQEHRLADRAHPAENARHRGHAAEDEGVELEALERPSEAAPADAADEGGHQTHVTALETAHHFGEHRGRHGDVAVADQEELMTRVKEDAGEVVDLGVEPDPGAAGRETGGHRGMAAGDATRHGEGGVGGIRDAEDQLVGRVVEVEKGLEVSFEVGVHPLERLEDADRGPTGGGRRRRRGLLPPLRGEHHQAQKEAEHGQARQGRHHHGFGYGLGL